MLCLRNGYGVFLNGKRDFNPLIFIQWRQSMRICGSVCFDIIDLDIGYFITIIGGDEDRRP